MGVPRLFKWISEHYPDAIQHFPENTKKFKVDHLYLDANGILHGCAQSVFNYGQNKRLIDASSHMSFEEKTKQVYINFFRQIRQLVDTVTPNKTLYIAIDGTAPLAKQAQQRQRRFVAASGAEPKAKFDSNCITPGTEFMHELNKYVAYAIRYEMQHNTTWKEFKVVFSPSSVPGEGEHKIMDYIRAMPSKMEDTHCMYGPDGDLVMLTLATHCPNMFLLREDQFNKGMIHYVDMGLIRKGLFRDMGFPGREEVDVVNDFILIGFFVGNDFLPKIEMVFLLEEGLDMMISEYRDGKMEFTKGGNIITEGFYNFIVKISGTEPENLCHRSDRQVPAEKFQNITLQKCIQTTIVDGVLHKSIDINKYKRTYYPGKLHVTTRAGVISVCKEYVRGLYWVFYYYTRGCPAYDWFYPHHYPPFMGDLARYKEVWDHIEFEKGEPSSPFLQLLCVLPPQSHQLLPEEYWRLMTLPNSPIYDFYPLQFDIDYEGKLRDYQGIATLPFVDKGLIKEAYDTIETPPSYRNKVGRIHVYVYNEDKSVLYKCQYGSIRGCHVHDTV